MTPVPLFPGLDVEPADAPPQSTHDTAAIVAYIRGDAPPATLADCEPGDRVTQTDTPRAVEAIHTVLRRTLARGPAKTIYTQHSRGVGERSWNCANGRGVGSWDHVRPWRRGDDEALAVYAAGKVLREAKSAEADAVRHAHDMEERVAHLQRQWQEAINDANGKTIARNKAEATLEVAERAVAAKEEP